MQTELSVGTISLEIRKRSARVQVLQNRLAWIQQPQFTLSTLSTRLPNIRTIVPPNVDFSVFKTFPIHERLKLQFRAEAFNLTNTAVFGAPTTTLTSAQFGTQVLTQINDARMIQLALRLQF